MWRRRDHKKVTLVVRMKAAAEEPRSRRSRNLAPSMANHCQVEAAYTTYYYLDIKRRRNKQEEINNVH